MRTNGEYLFESFKEAWAFLNAPTAYEKENGIKITSTRVVDDYPTLKVAERVTSDGRVALVLFFKNSTRFDIWKFWFPDETQMEVLKNALPDKIAEIEQRNEKKGIVAVC